MPLVVYAFLESCSPLPFDGGVVNSIRSMLNFLRHFGALYKTQPYYRVSKSSIILILFFWICFVFLSGNNNVNTKYTMKFSKLRFDPSSITVHHRLLRTKWRDTSNVATSHKKDKIVSLNSVSSNVLSHFSVSSRANDGNNAGKTKETKVSKTIKTEYIINNNPNTYTSFWSWIQFSQKWGRYRQLWRNYRDSRLLVSSSLHLHEDEDFNNLLSEWNDPILSGPWKDFIKFCKSA
ncbi:hypothetical protein RFI_23836 [Reticulomyxa filosa]|uniref:Uncharacterized protein n=1 Tax=Reticulomyxa filosa TaxID=46433 RepID=X6MKE2_RETFI|nr:hypothetical protein RFI_23836 [Reticulomyxa filosa]|eukprot:ETO13540.1 hypothetical protein RFI_23836 [Reticulomyxa filosa]